MLARVMLVLLFLSGVAMVIAGIIVSVSGWGQYEGIGAYTITGWILLGLGVLITLIATILSIIISLWAAWAAKK